MCLVSVRCYNLPNQYKKTTAITVNLEKKFVKEKKKRLITIVMDKGHL